MNQRSVTKPTGTQRTVTHSAFTIERVYDATPSRVFAAWSEPEAKARWFGGPDDWEQGEFSLDFRVGGREVETGGPKEGPMHRYDAIYQDIVPNRRIIYTYEMHLDSTRISVSLATIELISQGKGTRLIFTEQAAFLDGYDLPSERERGTRDLLDALDAELRAHP